MISLRVAEPVDTPRILRFIRALGEYERLQSEVIATEAALMATLFGERRYAEVVLADMDGQSAGFVLYFHNYSTFLARPGLYLEDLFVDPAFRKHGVGRALLQHLARTAADRGCGRLEWSALKWNRLAIDFYLRLGAVPMDEWCIYRLSGEPLHRLARADR